MYSLTFLQCIPCFHYFLLTLVLLLIARIKYPHPESLEVEEKKEETKDNISKSFYFYLIAISFCAFGFIDFPLITYHVETLNIFDVKNLPLLYSLAMLIDAFAALFFGTLFDKFGIKVLILSTLVSFLFALFIFIFPNSYTIYIGVALWGVGMGAQESILKSAVAKLTSKDKRSLGFGLFEGVFGLRWFVGSMILGILYEASLLALAVVSMAFEIVSIGFYILSIKSNIVKKT